MIPAPFDYHRPSTLAEAVRLLGELGEDARPLAGGHSLLPMMKLRLATPSHLVDLGALDELRGIRVDDTTVRIGAMVTQSRIVASGELREAVPILAETALQIADPQVRSLGTIGGNVANGDPGNDMPAVMQCLDATCLLTGPSGERRVPARDFYEAAYATALAPDEILTAIEIPRPPRGHGFAYEKLKRKVGDYATAAAACVLTVEDGRIADCAIALTNLGETPILATEAAAELVGRRPDAATLDAAVAAAKAVMRPASDARGPAEYRIAAGGVMVRRAVERAFARAGGAA